MKKLFNPNIKTVKELILWACALSCFYMWVLFALLGTVKFITFLMNG